MSNMLYLGRLSGEKASPLLYPADDLTTHAVITGMTGSGKTGLGVAILEEAALQRLPALILDPKGDLTNLLLHFSELRGSDFSPWVDPEAARRRGISVDELGEETAQTWRKGLSDWNLGPADIEKLNASARFTIYTPGSTAGVPINIVSSFEDPGMSWEDNTELLRERIASTVTALLGLIGLQDIDPLRSREHILLSNLLENAWRNDLSMNMVELIQQIQTPPFDRLGAFALDQFFAAKDRLSLAMLLNNFLASPSFQSWSEGQTLDYEQLLYCPDGAPRHSIFYLAHLSDEERMFFVSLFFATFESWMRTQRGTGQLRSLIYFDEVMGYVPPIANPPSKQLMVRMLKQARAFGVGLILATQNPVDVDYKALSNAGTWLIGRLQTERDVDRLMDGLRAAGGENTPSAMRDIISSLPRRTFLIHTVRGGEPSQFNTRWVMNYLAGPLTRSQIPTLNRMKGAVLDAAVTRSALPGAAAATPAPMPAAAPVAAAPTQPSVGSATSRRPTVPSGLHEIFLPVNQSPMEALQKAGFRGTPDVQVADGFQYVAHFFQQYVIQITASKFNLNQTIRRAFAAPAVPVSSFINWDDYACPAVRLNSVMHPPAGESVFAPLPSRLLPDGSLTTFRNAMIDWLYRNTSLSVIFNPQLKINAQPGESKEAFTERCRREARTQMDAEIGRLKDKLRRDKISLEDRLERVQQQIDDRRRELDQRRLETLATGGSLILNTLTGKRRRSINSTLSKQRMQSRTKDMMEQQQLLERQLKEQLAAMQQNEADQIQAVVAKWDDAAHALTVETVNPFKKDVANEILGVAWLPCYQARIGAEQRLLPAWSLEPDQRSAV